MNRQLLTGEEDLKRNDHSPFQRLSFPEFALAQHGRLISPVDPTHVVR